VTSRVCHKHVRILQRDKNIPLHLRMMKPWWATSKTRLVSACFLTEALLPAIRLLT